MRIELKQQQKNANKRTTNVLTNLVIVQMTDTI